LERGFPSIKEGSLPPALSPFFRANGIYLPVIVKAESGDGMVRSLVLIFVAVEADRLRPLLDWSLPASMPGSFAFLVHLFRMMFRARWEILEPRYQEAKFRAPSAERCAALARSVLADYDHMQQDAQTQGMGGLDKFYAAFSKELRPDVDAYSEEWMQLTQRLRTPAANPDELTRQLKDLLQNNAKWLGVSARQLELTISDQT
jgi:monoamine oxidase